MATDPDKRTILPHLDFSLKSPSLINPAREPGEPPVSPRVILAFTRPDYHILCRLAKATGPPRYLWDCALHEGSWEGRSITVAGPVLGAPYAVMVLERLIALGAKVVLALGWCGSLQSPIKVGSLVVPTAAVGGDGTSRHYLPQPAQPLPHPELCGLLQEQLKATDLPQYCGPIWTTDAFYRETAEQVRYYQSQGILAVDLELAALFAVGQYRRVAVAGLLAVSDELGELTWRPDFRSPAFRQARREAARVVLTTAAAAAEI
ncbi:MAG: nucleoside phosphorylase [Syntrophales bacterium]|nr:nucleoside phosphorylase [Syntrophales bacterium]MDD5643814.1 nucleoside phosphorylase [Syntrophales bacterium]